MNTSNVIYDYLFTSNHGIITYWSNMSSWSFMVVAYLQKEVRFFTDLVFYRKYPKSNFNNHPSPKTKTEWIFNLSLQVIMSSWNKSGRKAEIPKKFALSCLTHHFFRAVMEYCCCKEKQIKSHWFSRGRTWTSRTWTTSSSTSTKSMTFDLFFFPTTKSV